MNKQMRYLMGMGMDIGRHVTTLHEFIQLRFFSSIISKRIRLSEGNDFSLELIGKTEGACCIASLSHLF